MERKRRRVLLPTYSEKAKTTDISQWISSFIDEDEAERAREERKRQWYREACYLGQYAPIIFPLPQRLKGVSKLEKVNALSKSITFNRGEFHVEVSDELWNCVLDSFKESGINIRFYRIFGSKTYCIKNEFFEVVNSALVLNDRQNSIEQTENAIPVSGLISALDQIVCIDGSFFFVRKVKDSEGWLTFDESKKLYRCDEAKVFLYLERFLM